MTVLHHEIRSGAYADSIVLMQLQSALAGLPGVVDAGVVMGTAANLELLEANELLAASLEGVGADDLVLVVKADSDAAALDALAQVDELMTRRGADTADDFRPRSLRSAVRLLPEARWVLISVPGRYAGGVARQALELGRSVFLYSDNVALAEEVELKKLASERGLLVMGPDCGTAIVNGVGLGFANRVRKGEIGLVGASGTGVQAITCGVDARGAGISHAIGTGGRDLSDEVAGVTALQGVDLLAADPATRVIVLVSKPPSPKVAADLLAAARAAGKPVVVHFIGYAPPARTLGNLTFSASLDEAAAQAVKLAASETAALPASVEASGKYVRGLFAGGTLTYEAIQGLRAFFTPIYSNAPILEAQRLPDATRSLGHTILDLGADEYTVGRLHPMIDQDLRIRRIRQEAADPEVGVILLDVVLGDGAHPDPASELAPVIAEAIAAEVEVVAWVVGSEGDPQDLGAQIESLEAAGAVVVREGPEAVLAVCRHLGVGRPAAAPAADLTVLTTPVAAVNAGLESFHSSLVEQGASAVQLDWRPPAGGDEKLMAILEKMR